MKAVILVGCLRPNLRKEASIRFMPKFVIRGKATILILTHMLGRFVTLNFQNVQVNSSIEKPRGDGAFTNGEFFDLSPKWPLMHTSNKANSWLNASPALGGSWAPCIKKISSRKCRSTAPHLGKAETEHAHAKR